LASKAAAVFYFPIDWAWTVRRALRAIRPSVVLIMETELWPRLFSECRTRKIPVALVNGRISDKSFRRYKWIQSFIARVLDDLTLAIMQSPKMPNVFAISALARETAGFR
jgi:3-deoxy-D-manno-octulosonic-acid transferase